MFPLRGALLAIVATLTLVQTAFAASNTTEQDGTKWIQYQEPDGTVTYLDDNRQPSIYTGNYGNCLGDDSSIEITRFDAAYYQDNMTVLFHLEGSSPLNNQTLMMYIGVFAYGESRFDLVFNPCQANIQSLCPLNSSTPFAANGIIPVNQNDVANIPTLAYSIPDFEGQAVLRLFTNNTESEIGCYAAALTNGKSMAQVESVGTVLGIFTLFAMLASFATSIYGESVPTMRLHYAHSLSVGVVFAVWQHIFYTGALSMNWPSVLVAWWSNFAWAGGMIYSSSMQSSINNLLGNDVGNTSSVGAASAGSRQDGLAGGYGVAQLYGRSILPALKRARLGLPTNHPVVRDVGSEIYRKGFGHVLKRDLASRAAEARLSARDALVDASDGYKWYGQPVQDGLPLPGNYSGFAGTLAEENIRTSNAFMTGFLWLLILLVLLVAATMAFKWILEGLAKVKFVKQDRFAYFRQHWLGYSALVALRTVFVGFFMMMFLTMFQFTYDASGGVTAIAAILFIIFLVGIPGVVAYAVWYRLHSSKHPNDKAALRLEKRKLLGKVPWFSITKSGHPEVDEAAPVSAVPVTENEKTDVKPSLWKRMSSMGSMPLVELDFENIHDDEDYIKKFGWLSARFRRTRWWFFAAWIFYEFIRACFYAGASTSPLTQVFGLLVVEVIAFALIIWARPFESTRLNVIVVYLLGFSKVASVGLSSAFAIQFGIDRIIATVIGIVIIIIQGVLTIVTMIAVIVSLCSTYMSLSRNKEDFRPRNWAPIREKYFNHLDRVVNDIPREKRKKAEPVIEEEPKVGFEMRGARRLAKIEDEDADFSAEMAGENEASFSSMGLLNRTSTENVKSPSGYATPVGRSRAASRANSIRSVRSNSSLPYGARAHRPSWSTRDFKQQQPDQEVPDVPDIRDARPFTPIDMSREVPDDAPSPPSPVAAVPSSRSKSHSRRSSRNNVETVRARTSMDDVKIGGDVSTRDSIGKVPAPTTRPRAGTGGSTRASRASFASFDSSNVNRFSDYLPADAGGSRRHPLLTPAQEMEEWGPPTSASNNLNKELK